MRTTAVKCSSCGARLQPSLGATQVICEYCATTSSLRGGPLTPHGSGPRSSLRGVAWLLVPLVVLVLSGSTVAYMASERVSPALMDAGPISPVAGASSSAPEPAEDPKPTPVYVSSSPHYSSCFVDGNGDEALDMVGIYTWMDRPDALEISMIDGATGEALWRGAEVSSESRLLCGPTGLFAVETPTFQLQLYTVGQPEPVVRQLGDRVKHYAVGPDCLALTLKTEEVVHFDRKGELIDACEGPQHDMLGHERTRRNASQVASQLFGDELERHHDRRKYRHGEQVWLGTQDGMTYVALTSAPGTPFISISARRGTPSVDLERIQAEGPRFMVREKRLEAAKRGRALDEALAKMKEVWTVRLPLVGDDQSQSFRAVLTPNTLVVYGDAPGGESEASAHRWVGVGLDRGTLRYTSPVERDVFSLEYNGRLVVSDGLSNHFAADPDTGERIW